MGALNPAAVYGTARAMQDMRTADQQTEAFDTDQAIRRQTLQTNQAEAPLRQRALELDVGAKESDAARRPQVQAATDALTRLQSATAQMTLDEKRDQKKRYDEAVLKADRIKRGVQTFAGSRDPQAVADALGESYDELKGLKAVKNADGSITITHPSGNTQVLPKSIKNASGEDVSADDQLAMFATVQLDPIKHWQEQMANDLKVKAEGAKQAVITDRAVKVAGVRADAEVARTDAREESAKAKRLDAKVGRVGGEVGRQLKTKDLGGGFGMAYENDDDAALVGPIGADAQKIIRESHAAGDEAVDVSEAVRRAVDDNRVFMRQNKQAAIDAATKLLDRGVNPSDPKAVGSAARAGDADAKALMDSMGAVIKKYGRSFEQRMISQLPTKKK